VSYNCNYPLYEMFRDRAQSFTGVIAGAGVGRARMLVNEPGAVAESVQQQRVSGNFFSALGVNPVVGRSLTEADDNQANGRLGAVISYEYWRLRQPLFILMAAVGLTLLIACVNVNKRRRRWMCRSMRMCSGLRLSSQS
jgi:hypothetical protein